MLLRCALVAAIVALASVPVAASTFTLETSAFLNGGAMPATDAASGSCGGRNISPPLRMSGAPPGVRSYAVVMFDTDANGGTGFAHWIAYGIDHRTMTLPPGFGSQAAAAYTGGGNDAGTTLYYGPCPPPGDAPHHYVFTAYALDLAPAQLRAGLSRTALLHAIASHRLAQSQITGRYGR